VETVAGEVGAGPGGLIAREAAIVAEANRETAG